MRAIASYPDQLTVWLQHPSDDRWSKSEEGQSIWPLNGYLREGWRTRNWFADGVIKYHRTVATYLNTLLENRLHIEQIVEWGPDAAQVRAHPEWADEVERPMFLIFSASAC